MDVLQRLRDWVTGPEFPVVLTAVVVAIPGAYLLQSAVGATYSFGFLSLLALGVGVPRVYDEWPRTYDRPLAVAWTLGACAVVAAEMTALFVLLEPLAGGTVAAIVAFIVADLGNVALVTVAGGTTPN
ncbi:MAG: hypothetical protein ABEJ68_05015 [Halobacteriaceae archaeon]